MLIAIAAGLGAGGAAFVGGYMLSQARRADMGMRASMPVVLHPTEILVSDGQVIDRTLEAQRLLDCGPDERQSWAELIAALEPFFGPLPEQPPMVHRVLFALDDPATTLSMSPGSRDLKLSVAGPQLGTGEALRLRCDNRELGLLRQIMSRAPGPVWMTDADRGVLWHNAAFADLCAQAGLEDTRAAPFVLPPGDSRDVHVTRSSIGNRHDDAQSWFEVHSFRMPGGLLHFAQNIDAVIHAEAAQRNFLQTLTRIFAHLPIALAVFDRERRLVLFNPALVDLTSLPAEFLSGRPNLLSFFDMLRERQIMPEPKDYGTWRDKLREVIAAASNDHYVETWNLSSGLTYRITGRPHPDGGIAFVLEDITAEVTLTRGFRQEIAITQSVLDSLDDAVAVFSQLGTLSLCNEAYRRLWGVDRALPLSEHGIAEATAEWQAACEPSPVWPELRDFVITQRDRAGWDAELALRGGRPLVCRAEPLVGGATMVRFTLVGSQPPPALQAARIAAENTAENTDA